MLFSPEYLFSAATQQPTPIDLMLQQLSSTVVPFIYVHFLHDAAEWCISVPYSSDLKCAPVPWEIYIGRCEA
jgi:hypothetical protein